MHDPFAWQRSSYSGATSNCVEMAWNFPVAWIRDSKDATKPPIRISIRGWQRFRQAICTGSASRPW
ncbi:DUF397 domain-containing protein [Streptomyces canus]|uniref:DUF397 domain-containing protein n=1 Tax=Streptomyces canus TaxID=58343 RepID=UPI0034005E19